MVLTQVRINEQGLDNSVTTSKINGGAVTTDKLNDFRPKYTTDGTDLMVDIASGKIRTSNNNVAGYAGGTLTITNVDGTYYIQCDSSGAVTFNTVGFSADQFPIGTVNVSMGHLESLIDERSWAEISTAPTTHVSDFEVSALTGLDVHINSGLLRNTNTNGSPYYQGVASVDAQTFTVPDNQVSDIVLNGGGGVLAFVSSNLLNPILDSNEYLAIARVTAVSGAITGIIDLRAVYSIPNSRAITELNMSRVGVLTVQINGILSYKRKNGQTVTVQPATITVTDTGDNTTQNFIIDDSGHEPVIVNANPVIGDFFIGQAHLNGGDIDYFNDYRTIYQTVDQRPIDACVLSSGTWDSLYVKTQPGIVRFGTSIFVITDGDAYLMTDDATNYVEIDNTGATIFNTTGFTDGNLPLAIVVTAGGNIVSITDKRAFLSMGTGSSTNTELQPSIGSGLTVHILAGHVRTLDGLSAITEQDVTVFDDGYSFIEVRNDGTIFVVNGNVASGYSRGAFPIARATAASGVVTAIQDDRESFTTESAKSDFDLVWSSTSLDITVQPGHVRRLGGHIGGQYRYLVGPTTLTLAANTKYVIYLDPDSGMSVWDFDINKIVIGNISNIGLPTGFNGTPLYAIETNGSGVDSFYDLRVAQVAISVDNVSIKANGALTVPFDDVTIEAVDDTVRVKDGGITDSKLADFFVTNLAVSQDITSPTNANYLGGRLRQDTTIVDVASGSTAETITDNANNYIELDSTGVVSINTIGFTSGKIPLYLVVAASGVITSIDDKRAWIVFSASSSGLTDFVATDGGGLTLNITSGKLRVNNRTLSVSGTALTLIDNCDNYIGVDNYGNFFQDSTDVTAITTVNIDTVPLWKVTTSSGSITSITDLRVVINFDSDKNFKITYNSESTSVNVEAGGVIIGNSYQLIGSAGLTLSAGYNWIYVDLENNVLAVTTTNPLQDADALHNKYVLYKLHVVSGNIDTDFTDFRKLSTLNSGIPSDLKVYSTNSGLNIKVLGGKIRVDSTIIDVAPSSVFPVTDNTTNYVQVDSSGSVTFNSVGFTLGTLPLATVVTSGGNVTSVTDARAWLIVAAGGENISSETPTGTLDGMNTDFNLFYTPITNSEHVYLNGLRQKPTVDYTIAFNVISFIDAPESTDSILVDYRRL